MSKFSNDLVEGALVLIFAHQFFDFCKYLVDKLTPIPQPEQPTTNSFANLRVSLVNETPQPAVPFPWSPAFPPAIPLAQKVRRSQRPTFRSTRFLPEEPKAEVVVRQQETTEAVVRQQETKTVLVTETTVDRRHNEFTERVDEFIKIIHPLKRISTVHVNPGRKHIGRLLAWYARQQTVRSYPED
jgi:hypothetical protein